MWFLKEHLSGEYHWNGSAVYSGNPTRRKFDRTNGEQILYMINLYGSISQRSTIKDGMKMEELLQNQLPLETMSEMTVFNWLREVYNDNL
jgi:hypothetical protein